MERKEQLSHEERILLFGPAESNSAYKAAQTHDLWEAALGGIQEPVGKCPTNPSKVSTFMEFATQVPFVEDLSMEARYIVFPESVGTSLIYDHVVNFTRNTTPNCEAFPSESKVLGYVFHEVRFGFYCLQMFKHADGLGLSCQLQEGFAPALTPFWSAVKESLARSGLIKNDPEESEDIVEDFDGFFDSDTEDCEFSLDLSVPENKFMDLRSDPSLVVEWIEDIQDPNFCQDTLLVLAYNLQSRANVDYLMEQFPQQLFEAVAVSLSSAMRMTLPGIRSACKFLDCLAQNAQVKVSEEKFQNLVDQLARWTLSQANADAVTQSVEIADLLSKNLLKFYESSKESLSVQKELIETIRHNSNSGTVKQNLHRFLSAIF